MKIRDILRAKGSEVVTIGSDRPIQEAIRVLVEHNIGALVVMDGTLRGIITERDLLRMAAAEPQRLDAARVQDFMTVDVITGHPDADIRQVMDVMTDRRIRHLPVVAEGIVCGMISIGDVVNALREHVETENQQLHAYIAGTPM